MSDEFAEKFKTFADRSVRMAPRCVNEESTKLFLILPFLNFLGFDDRNPDEVCPEHSADFSEKYKNRVDFAILMNEKPVIAIECKAVGLALKDERGQLRSYFNAAPTVKMGLITDGLIYEFYADSDEPNMMDQNAFLSFNLREIAKGNIENSVDEGLRSLQKSNFDPENIGAEAKRKLIFQNLVQQIAKLAEEPSEAFVRLLLQNAGLSHIRTKALAEYSELTRGAFREFVNIRILKRLDLSTKETQLDKVIVPDIIPAAPAAPNDGIITTELELSVYDYTKRRLSFLIKEEGMFEEIDKIEYRDYRGKFVVFYKKERSGRLFDFYECGKKKYKIDFGKEAGGEIETEKLGEIDAALVAVFRRRLADLEGSSRQAKTVKGD